MASSADPNNTAAHYKVRPLNAELVLAWLELSGDAISAECILQFWPDWIDWGMFPYATSALEKEWQPGPYSGVDLLILHKNEQTGGVTVLRRFRAGVTVPAHIHPDANEFVYLLSGDWVESGVTHTTGAFFSRQKVVHTVLM